MSENHRCKSPQSQGKNGEKRLKINVGMVQILK